MFADIIVVKWFVNLHAEKKINDKDDELLIKNLLDEIEFLKQELTNKDTFIKAILENYRQTIDYKSQTVKEIAKQDNYSDKG